MRSVNHTAGIGVKGTAPAATLGEGRTRAAAAADGSLYVELPGPIASPTIF
jgi:hypothetical protein